MAEIAKIDEKFTAEICGSFRRGIYVRICLFLKMVCIKSSKLFILIWIIHSKNRCVKLSVHLGV